MGCICSRNRNRASLYRIEADPLEDKSSKTTFSWDKIDRADYKDFTYQNLKDERKVKAPGSIQGQQFVIEKCQGCTICLFDTSAAVTIDDCTNCRIIVGPVDGSLFVRDCKDCVIIAACRQFRTRDCSECNCMLLCNTKPVVESSSKIQFGCFDIGYHGLKAQLQAIGFSKFRNFWSDVYDFTPSSSSWSFLTKDVTGRDLLEPVSEEVNDHLTSDIAEAIPKTHGQRPPIESDDGFLFLLYPDTASKAATEFIYTAANQGATLLRTNEAKIDQQAADQLHHSSGWEPEAIANLQAKVHISLEFQGAGCDAVKALAAAAESMFKVSTTPEIAQQFHFAGLGK